MAGSDATLTTPWVLPVDDRFPKTMIAAMRHQFANGIQLMRAVIRRSAARDADTLAYAERLEARLDALGGVLGALIGRPGSTLPLGSLVYDALDDCGMEQWERLGEVGGPPVEIGGQPALSLALLLRELASNAAEHGALRPGGSGRLSVTWALGDADLDIAWVEEPGQFVPGPPGFGLMVMDEMVPYELDGEVRRASGDGAYRVDIRLPRRRLGWSVA